MMKQISSSIETSAKENLQSTHLNVPRVIIPTRHSHYLSFQHKEKTSNGKSRIVIHATIRSPKHNRPQQENKSKDSNMASHSISTILTDHHRQEATNNSHVIPNTTRQIQNARGPPSLHTYPSRQYPLPKSIDNSRKVNDIDRYPQEQYNYLSKSIDRQNDNVGESLKRSYYPSTSNISYINNKLSLVSDLNETTEKKKQSLSNTINFHVNSRNNMKKKCPNNYSRLLPLVSLLAVLLVGIIIATILVGTLYKAHTTTTTTTSTTSTSASTSTITSTTSTSASSTSTSTTTTRASTITTTTETTTTTTETTTATTETTTTITTTTTKTTTTATTTNGCFYGGDQVNLIDGGVRSIERLKVGDRIWSISSNGNDLIPDEIVLMMDKGPNQIALFYTFQTDEDNHVSLTGSHNIPVFDSDTNQIKIIRASKVTMKHRLIMFGGEKKIKNISINRRQGFYSPLTLSGYLFVNNISTSVFTDSYQASSVTLQHVFGPIRVYYRMMRWIFGKNYDPFGTKSSKGLHSIPVFLQKHHLKIRIVYYSPRYIVLIVLIVFILSPL